MGYKYHESFFYMYDGEERGALARKDEYGWTVFIPDENGKVKEKIQVTTQWDAQDIMKARGFTM